VDGPPGRGSVVMADIQHDVWLYCYPDKSEVPRWYHQ
jgi:hypothetical protein